MNGILIINKKLGYTSRDVVNKVCKCLNTKKVGHTGTLDPKASGVLVLCVGNALKICELLQNNEKEYVAEVILGISTDTLDMDFNATILEDVKVDVSNDEIYNAVTSFKGKYLQEVPMYSSVKVNGRKLYEYARNNIPVTVPKKEVEIKNIEIIDNIRCVNNKIYFTIKTTVSKGTYIRALIRDIGNKLGVPAVMNSLVRTRQGNFSIEDSYTLDDIEKDNYKLISIKDALNIRCINVDDEKAKKIRNGVRLNKFFDDEYALLLHNGVEIAIYKNWDDLAIPYKVF
jgi:tRNA pseudouridine55 synthase